MQKHILRVFEYFNFFSYPVSFENVHQYLEIKISRKRLKQELKQLISEKIVSHRHGLYTLGEYHKGKLEIRNSKFEISQKKLNNYRFRAYIKLISLFSQIKLVGLSGSISMMNAKENDDIDLFIISSKNRLWTARLLCVIIAMLMGVKRSRYKTDSSKKVCLNLFFDETELNIPKFKKNYYIAHEIMQMKPIINKNNIYELFLYSNKWVCDIFPNSQPPMSLPTLSLSFPRKRESSVVSDFLELFSKKLQLFIIKKHKTNELITGKQLWFFPEDFEKQLPKFARKKALS